MVIDPYVCIVQPEEDADSNVSN